MSDCRIKLHGLYRTGTNYLAHLLRANYRADVLENACGWKHGLLRTAILADTDVGVVLCVKNPLAWLVSMWRYKRAGEDPFPRWLVANEPLAILWSAYYAYWLSVKAVGDVPIFVVAYERLIRNPRAECAAIMEGFSDSPPTERFEDIMGTAERGGRISTRRFDRSYYLEQRYMAEYTDEAMEHVLRVIDLDIASAYGYGIGQGE